ncbi:beta-ketoacyl-ACP synthase [Janthinobacterium sp. GW458P]|uniref:beta-ketoacyl-ACP synthase n=1 Tax=Janthinobacterium sp. GW458P TaxID=1981504 RepID=UPI001552758C|nr:beta-ketoacyl-ACP synthase [Janthinobacterium sp. GW458P]MBE3023109.1 beta-ketoacyl-ACP synthase [Janthinobacterium sp. GW458P]
MAGLTAYLNDCGIVCALGASRAEVRARLFAAHSGVVPTGLYTPGCVLPLGLVDVALPSVEHHAIAARSRNNRMALAALAQIRPAVEHAIARYGADRVAVVIGTSTSGIAETEDAIARHVTDGGLPDAFHYGQQEMASPALMLAEELGIDGPALVHSSACSSSAKAMASAARLLRMGLCDAVLTGGVDTLCGFTVAGFSALASVSAQRCNPLGAGRDGINIGEGAALFLMTAERAAVALRGWGESSDGHHMSAPDPEGGGARLAIGQALARAGITAAQVDYVNLHGTATLQNDAMEARVVSDLFGGTVTASSTKPLTGHALGAAAAIEAALCWLAMQDDNAEGFLPPHLWDGVPDESLPPLRLALPGARLGRPLAWALSNSFAFGGSNAALLFGRGA